MSPASKPPFVARLVAAAPFAAFTAGAVAVAMTVLPNVDPDFAGLLLLGISVVLMVGVAGVVAMFVPRLDAASVAPEPKQDKDTDSTSRVQLYLQ
jgi:hypothetical protein